MLVTIFSDASFCHDKKVGGWGAWARSERGIVSSWGAFKWPVTSANMAELYAAVNAVHMVLKSDIFSLGDELLLQIDNLAALGALEGKAKTEWPTRGLAEMGKLLAAGQAKLRVRHVKGHSKNGQPRSWVHNFCDRGATKGLKLARQRFA